MAAPVNKMLRAMRPYFLSKTPITQRIASRLTRGIAQDRIVAHQRPEGEIPTVCQEFVEFELSTRDKPLLLNTKSRWNLAIVDFRFFSRFPEGAAELYDAFHDVITTDDADGRWHGTWGADTVNATVIQGARWAEETEADRRDSLLGMSYMEVSLVVPFVG